MIKGLEALKEYRVQQQGVNVYADELLDMVEKELKALEIIKNKPFNNTWFVFYKDYEEYCSECEYADERKRLTPEEWNSLKEVLS